MTNLFIDKTIYTGRPSFEEGRLPKELRAYDFLDSLGVSYQRMDHDPTDTIEVCHEVEALLQIRICKNLFLCNAQKTNFYLLLTPGEKSSKQPFSPNRWAAPDCPLHLLNLWNSFSTSPPVPSVFWG
ncbi:uncharacterized conserved protein [Clostridium sp. CAG:149]|nr:uncharacterized conserved protein [Clostridium sp. CAG:149]